MKISQKGIAYIKAEEGERLTGYLDSTGLPTIGVGHTGYVGEKAVHPGMEITQDTSTALLLSDLATVENALVKLVTVPLNQNQYDALCSLVFNIGVGAFRSSTLLKRLNTCDYEGVAEAFLMWKRAGNSENILLPRRQRERALFLS
jgi:lysozyme